MTFTERQMEVLLGVARGDTDETIAEALGISRSRVRQHVAEVARKLETDRRGIPRRYAETTGRNPWPRVKVLSRDPLTVEISQKP